MIGEGLKIMSHMANLGHVLPMSMVKPPCLS